MSSPEVDTRATATPTLALPYPVLADPADVPADMGALALRIEALWGAINGFAKLDSSGLVPVSELPTTLGAVTIANTIAGLGAGTSGRLGLLRLLPTTLNTGGAVALPAATLTVGDTTDFPTAGTVTTPNGDVAYTGKTATTLTGCTGGSGTLAASALVQLKSTVTPASGGWVHVSLVYDATMGKWVGLGGSQMQYGNLQYGPPGGLNTYIDPSNGNSSPIPHDGFPWRAYDAAGLRPQVRILSASGSTGTGSGTIQWRPSFHSCARAATSGTFLTGDSTAASAPSTVDTSRRVWPGGPWGSIGAYTVADLFGPGAQVQQTAGSILANQIVGDVVAEWRWVG